jgi:peptidoglycan/xylan/chitin deacetylase (PgdA/CDA1 family)
VLAYHGVGSFSRRLDPFNLMVNPARFRYQMLTLQRRGYRFISLAEFAGHLDAGTAQAAREPGREDEAGEEPEAPPSQSTPPQGVCAVTFDDGTLDNLEVVAPLLAKLGVPATVFVCPGLLGRDHFAMPARAGVRLMNADELRKLAAWPLIEIGCHTREHTDLSAASGAEAYKELTSSKQQLQELLQRPVEALAYPECRFSPACPVEAERAGYTVAVTCGGLGSWGRFELTRESIDSRDGRLGFALKSRRLFWPLRESRAGRLLRSAGRVLRPAIRE